MTESEFKNLANQLATAGPEAYALFEQALNQALSKMDVTQIQAWVAAAEPFTKTDPYLQAWQQYAQAILARHINGRTDQTICIFERLLAEREGLPPRLLGRVLNGLGLCYTQNGQWDRATRCYQDAILRYEATDDQLGLGKTYHNLAAIHYKSGDYESTIAYAQRSIDLLKTRPDDRLWQGIRGNALNELGLAQMKLGDLAAARITLIESLAIDTELENQAGQAIIFNNLAHVHRDLGDLKQAQSFYDAAQQLGQQLQQPREIAEAKYGLGLLQFQTEVAQHLEAAERLLAEAFEQAQASNHYEILTEISLAKADLQEKQGHLPEALAENRQTVDLVESLRANIVLPEDRVRMQGSRIEAYEKLVWRLFQAGQFCDAFYYAEMAKSRAFIEMLAGRPVRQPVNVPGTWLAQEQRLREQLRDLYQAPNANQAQITDLEATLAELRQRIRLQDAEFDSFHTVDPLTAEAVMARLPAEAVLLEYFTVGEQILAFVLTQQSITVKQLPLTLTQLGRVFAQNPDGTRGHIRHLVKDSQHRLRDPWPLEKLRASLLDPLGEQIWSAALLCIIPHGLLHYLPFHALYQADDGLPTYLLGQAEQPRQIIYAPSATTLLEHCQQKKQSTQTGCLAIGYNDPALHLTQAEFEAEQIARVTNGVSYVGSAANRPQIFQESPAYRYLHFSCHGWFNPTWPMASSLNLADGTLDAADILQKLSLNAELVSLSACETGRSHLLRGDELVGLPRAFLYAGTPAVLVSHWVVDELATRLLMERFYHNLMHPSQEAVAAKAHALSEAQSYIRTLTLAELRHRLESDGLSSATISNQLTYLKTVAGYEPDASVPETVPLLAHPYYWAGFFLVGDRFAHDSSISLDK